MDNTAAALARARKDPAIATPPPAPKGTRTSAIRNLHLQVAGRKYAIGEAIDGPTPWERTMGGAATVTIPIRSPDGSLLEILADESLMQEEGIRLDINDVRYMLDAVSPGDDGLLTLSFIDEAAWRTQRYDKFLASTRATSTCALFVQRLIDEASRPPLDPIRTFIPELGDKQRILAPR